MKRILILTAFLAAFVILISGCGPREGQNHEEHMKFAMWHVSNELQLNEEQKDRMQGIMSEVKDKMSSMHDDRDETQKRVVEMVRSGDVNEQSVNAMIDEKLAKFEEVRPFIVAKVVELYSILNSEQREKAADLMEKHKPGQGYPSEF